MTRIKPWYPQYMFYELDGYVVELHFLTDEENGRSADIFRAVLGTMELHFSEKEAGGSSSSRRRLTGFLLHPLFSSFAGLASAAPLFTALQSQTSGVLRPTALNYGVGRKVDGCI